MKLLHMKKFLKIGFVILFVFTLSSCSKGENRSLVESTSAFVQNNDQVILFGSIDIMSILNKAEYKKIPKIGVAIEEQITKMKDGLNLEAGFYFAMEGPFENGNPGTVYMFAEVKDFEKLKETLMKDGYDFNEKNDIQSFRDGDVSVGIKDKLAILITQSKEYDEYVMAEEAFEMTTGDLMSGSGAKLLAKKSDISINTHLYNQFVTANKVTAELAKDKKDQLADMMKESFGQANIHFENGQMRVAIDNEFSAKLTKRMMFNADPGAGIRSMVGQGEPKMAIATNLDMEKMQAWVEDFYPGGLQQVLANEGGPLQMAMVMAGGKISNLINGKMAFAMFGEPTAGAMVPDFTFYAGFGPNGKPMADFMQKMSSQGTMILSIDDKGVSGASSTVYAAKPGGTLSIPQGCESFGKTAISGFINLEEVDTKAFELEGAQKLVELVKYMNFTFGMEGGEILIKTKNSSDNVLKQSVQHMLKEFEGQIGELAI
jgi:hypothetical protein